MNFEKETIKIKKRLDKLRGLDNLTEKQLAEIEKLSCKLSDLFCVIFGKRWFLR